MTASESDDDDPLVSVVISTYNRPTYLERAVESVRDQRYDPVELVVVDDHSDTPASDVLSEMALDGFHSVTCHRHDENRGANAARNTGIEVADGEFLAFLDDDDRWHPEKLARQVVAAEGGAGVVYTGIVASHEDGTERHVPPPITGDITKALLCRNVVGTLSTVLVRADVAAAVPLDERFPAWADLEWYVRLSTETSFERVADPLVTYEFDSHGRLSDDYEKKRRGYELFVEEFDGLAAGYGRLFRRKFRGYAAFRIGSTALDCGRYREARRHLSRAVRAYPLEPQFVAYLGASLGGRPTHELARAVDGLVPG